ncbi:spore coat protein [Guptibacillus spartinae]|uniref:spore coat protein n=1 Tax=Guptibacillus spartinae TaxID=3025679 RepID=UPI0023626F03|nr:spore coat protein [Pseudalkalibacillus spartinae]
MSELKTILSDGLKKENRNTLLDLLLSDVLKKNGVSEKELNLSVEQKQKIKDVFATIQKQVDQITK